MAKTSNKNNKASTRSSKETSNQRTELIAANGFVKGNKLFNLNQGHKFRFKFPKSGAGKHF